MFVEEKNLPYTAIRVTKHGDIKLPNGDLMELIVVNGRKFVELEWVDGKKLYEVGLLVCVVKYDIKLPVKFWKELEPLYLDGSGTNVSFANVSYRYRNGPIEVEGYPGFCYIPYHNSYAINRSGEAFGFMREPGKIKPWLITEPVVRKNIQGGYRVAWFRDDKRTRTTLSRHRALCLTFLRYDVDPDTIIVNHKDGKPGNDWLDNLEWSTYSKNNQHAIDNGLVKRLVPVLMKDLRTGLETRFDSVARCAQTIGRSHSLVAKRMIENPKVRYQDGLIFKRDDGTEWAVIQPGVVNGPVYRSIIFRDIYSGVFVVTDDARAASQLTGVSSPNILIHANTQKIEPTMGFNFRFLDDDKVWPNHTEKHLRIYKKYPKEPPHGVIVHDSNGKELEFYESMDDAAVAYGKSRAQISYYCRNGYPFSDKKFSLYRTNENLGPPIE